MRRIIYPLLVAVPFLIMAFGCAPAPAPEPIVRTVEVQVPVSVYCTERPTAPTYANNDAALAAAPNIFEVIKLHVVGTGQRMDFEREQAAALAVCRGE